MCQRAGAVRFETKLQFWGVGWVECACFGFCFVNGKFFKRFLL